MADLEAAVALAAAPAADLEEDLAAEASAVPADPTDLMDRMDPTDLGDRDVVSTADGITVLTTEAADAWAVCSASSCCPSFCCC